MSSASSRWRTGSSSCRRPTASGRCRGCSRSRSGTASTSRSSRSPAPASITVDSRRIRQGDRRHLRAISERPARARERAGASRRRRRRCTIRRTCSRCCRWCRSRCRSRSARSSIDDGFAAGTLRDLARPRSGGWPAADRGRRGARCSKFKKPVINDEPIGAADAAVPGRRDNDPARFRRRPRRCAAPGSARRSTTTAESRRGCRRRSRRRASTRGWRGCSAEQLIAAQQRRLRDGGS